MELIEDIESEIFGYLNKRISTLISKRARHNYFQKRGIYFKYIVPNTKKYIPDLLQKYRTRLLIQYEIRIFPSEPEETIVKYNIIILSRVFSQNVLDNIESVDMRGLCNIGIDGLERLKNLKRIKADYNRNAISQIIYLSSIKAERLMTLTLSEAYTPYDIEDIELISKLNIVIELKLLNANITESKKVIELLRNKIKKIQSNMPIEDEYPNLETLVITPEGLLQTKVVFPKLKKIYYTQISETLTDPGLKKYFQIAKYRKFTYFKIWDDLDYSIYSEARSSFFNQKRWISLKYVELLTKLEEEYRILHTCVGKKNLILTYEHFSEINSEEMRVKLARARKVLEVECVMLV